MNALRVVLPVVLGIAAAMLNFIVLRGSAAPLELVTVHADVKADTELTEDMLERLPVRAEKDVFKSAVPYAERGLLLGRRVTRPLSAGEVVLYGDVNNLDEENIRMYLKPGESTLTMPVKMTRIAPGLRRGDAVGILVAARPARGLPPMKASAGGSGDYRILGPFRLLSLGAVDRYKAMGFGDSRMVMIAVTRLADGRLDPTVAALDEAIAYRPTSGNGAEGGVLAVEYYQASSGGH